MEPSEIYNLVQARYGELAESSLTRKHTAAERSVAEAFGYEASQLNAIPESANLGVSCGNPLVLANLREGETVIDLGCGGGIDVLLAAQKVGRKGKAIGVDMTKSMLDLAQKNAEKAGASNASFVKASITSIPLPNSTANCIISNCVVNLVPGADKQQAFHEMFRLLIPGGRVAISDILIRKKLPEKVARDLSLYVGCIAGASQVHEYQEYLHNAGFKDTMIIDTRKDLNIFKAMIQDQQKEYQEPGCQSTKTCCEISKPMGLATECLLERDFNEWAGESDPRRHISHVTYVV
ncbi:uncharacterized protein N7458_004315 [Penicillium daleae]|uniref:Arsenite methyltransferase n=1 Tax=Penicillium daleae TaxID=63821 RepID=A0AAD6G4V3_9EURO|nr:uncharacterized protein N7458_004315 [Penicillium daleae]KAJ5456051.1 hypothetical protein N7458_004315 [Penicillium daleae]